MTEPGEILKDEARSAWENVLDGAVWRAEKYRAALEKIREIEDMADAPCANRESKSCGTTCVCSLLVAEKALVQPFAHQCNVCDLRTILDREA